MIPFGIPQTLFIGELDPIVPREQAFTFRDAAGLVGDLVEIREIEGAGHFELVNPSHRAIEEVRAAVLELIDR